MNELFEQLRHLPGMLQRFPSGGDLRAAPARPAPWPLPSPLVLIPGSATTWALPSHLCLMGFHSQHSPAPRVGAQGTGSTRCPSPCVSSQARPLDRGVVNSLESPPSLVKYIYICNDKGGHFTNLISLTIHSRELYPG